MSALNPARLLRMLWRHRDLIRQFTRRDVLGRYKGSYLGLLWSFVNPVALLAIYTFVFGVVFRARWPQARADSLPAFALVLFCSLIAFNIFGECVGRASTVVVAVPNYVKKVVFPVEILPVTVLGSALFHAGVSLAVLLAANLAVNHTLSLTLPLLPVAALPLLCWSLGLAWFLASLGVFVRDVNYTVALIVQVLLFTTPVFYPLEAVPARFQALIRLNPLTAAVEDFRRVALWGLPPDWSSLLWRLPVAAGVMLLGYAWFMKTKKGFADVL